MPCRGAWGVGASGENTVSVSQQVGLVEGDEPWVQNSRGKTMLHVHSASVSAVGWEDASTY